AFRGLGWRGRRGEARAQPFLVIAPKRIHRLSGRALRIALHPERHYVAAVAIDEGAHRLLAVTLAQESKEVAAVEVVAVERKAAAFGIHLGERAQAARRFG